MRDKLSDKLRTVVTARMRRAYHAGSALAAEAELSALAAELDATHPGAAASLREGLACRYDEVGQIKSSLVRLRIRPPG